MWGEVLDEDCSAGVFGTGGGIIVEGGVGGVGGVGSGVCWFPRV